MKSICKLSASRICLSLWLVLGSGGLGYSQTPPSPSPSEGLGPRAPESPAHLVAPDPDSIGCIANVVRPNSEAKDWMAWWDLHQHQYRDLPIHGGCGIIISGMTPPPRWVTTEQIDDKILPYLFEILRTESDPDLITSALIAVGKIAREKHLTLSLIQSWHQSEQPEIRESAILAFGLLGHQDAIPLLQALAKEAQNPSRSRELAVISLGLWTERRLSAPLVREIPRTLFSILEDASQEPELRVLAALSLSQTGRHAEPGIAHKLSSLFQNPLVDIEIRKHLPAAIAGIASKNQKEQKQLLEVLLHALETTDEYQIAESCIQALAALAKSEIEPCYDSCLEDCSYKLILNTFMSQARQSRFPTCKNLALVSLARMGRAARNSHEQIFSFLLNTMKDGEDPIQPWAGLAIGLLAYEQNLHGNQYDSYRVHEETYQKFRTTTNPDHKAAYALALGLMKNESCKPDLRQSLTEVHHSEYQGFVALSLGMLRAREYEPYLDELSGNSIRNPKLFLQIQLGFSLSRAYSVPKVLHEMLEEKDGNPPRLIETRLATIALGMRQHTRSVSPLLDFANGDRASSLHRSFAIAALGQIAYKDNYPWQSRFSEVIGIGNLSGSWLDPKSAAGLYSFD